jgi:transcriptional regulator
MYMPPHTAEENIEVLHQLMRANSFATLVNMEADGLNANHLPFEILPPTLQAPYGTLRAHVAKRNLLWSNFNPALEALVTFQGPHAYISASWYEQTKISGKEVPTYNYAVVHAYGKLRVIEDASVLLKHLHALSDYHESSQAIPWSVDDAPPDFIHALMQAIVGIEIPLTRLVGKWKASKNETAQDRANIANELRAGGRCSDLDIANLVRHPTAAVGT